MNNIEYNNLEERVRKYEGIIEKIHDTKTLIDKLLDSKNEFRLITPQDNYFSYKFDKSMVSQIVQGLKIKVKMLEDEALNI